MDLRYFECIVGNTLRVPLADGHQLRVDWRDGTTLRTMTGDVSGGYAMFQPTAAGNYYLAVREDSTADWQRYGVLESVDLIDATREQMISEIDAINEHITALEGVQFQVTDPSGTAVTRMTLNRLLEARGRLEARLALYETGQAGRPPLRFG